LSANIIDLGAVKDVAEVGLKANGYQGSVKEAVKGVDMNKRHND